MHYYNTLLVCHPPRPSQVDISISASSLAPMSEGQNPPPPLTNDHSSFDSFPSAPSQKIDSSSPVRELNRLLESALRMGGHLGIEQEDASKTIDNVALTENANFPLSGGDPAGIDENNAYTASESTTTWRLDTARRLSLVGKLIFCFFLL